MVWTVCHLWPSGSHFFNCYHHWPSIVLRSGDGTASFLQSSEGLTQGYSLDMVAYGIAILPLIKNLKAAHPNVTQPRYADDVSVLRMYGSIELYFNLLKKSGPGLVYYP